MKSLPSFEEPGGLKAKRIHAAYDKKVGIMQPLWVLVIEINENTTILLALKKD